MKLAARRQEILNRLDSLNADPLFRQIFNAKETKIHLPSLINEPNIVVINASRALGSMKQLYGRYFLSVIKAAGEARSEDALPCFVYVDECDEFADFNIADILLKLRRNRMALTLANQETRRIQAQAREAITGMAVKFINATVESARELSDATGLCDPEGRRDISALINRPDFDFALHIAGSNELHDYRLQPFAMNKLPRRQSRSGRKFGKAFEIVFMFRPATALPVR
jgi:hypothetical protein